MSAIAMVSRFIMIEPKYSKSEPAIFISVGVLRRQLLQQLLRLFQIARVEPFSEPAELLRYRRMIAPDEQGEQHDRNAISDVPMKKSWKPVRSITNPEAPASKLPGSTQREVIRAYWLAANSVEASEDM
jgi:hypothetical protein